MPPSCWEADGQKGTGRGAACQSAPARALQRGAVRLPTLGCRSQGGRGGYQWGSAMSGNSAAPQLSGNLSRPPPMAQRVALGP